MLTNQCSIKASPPQMATMAYYWAFGVCIHLQLSRKFELNRLVFLALHSSSGNLGEFVETTILLVPLFDAYE